MLYAEGSALAIYILHPALRNLAQRQLLPWWGVRGMAADWLLPVLTLALALLAAGIWLWLKGLWNKTKNPASDGLIGRVKREKRKQYEK